MERRERRSPEKDISFNSLSRDSCPNHFSDNGTFKDHRGMFERLSCIGSMRLFVLLVLCLQNSLYTVLRRYSRGILQETYSTYECLVLGEFIKMIFSAWMITGGLLDDGEMSLHNRLVYLTRTSGKMVVLAMIYGAMNILSFVALRNIGAGVFTIFAQAKIFTTALFSAIILSRSYSWTKWRALLGLVLGVILFTEPIWGDSSKLYVSDPGANPLLGTLAVLTEVTLSGFASIYFEKVIKLDPLQLTIWERNFQLALASVPVYFAFIVVDGGGVAGLGGGWSPMGLVVAFLSAAGGLLVALSIKYGDSVLKTLATSGAIVLSSILDFWFLKGPLTPTMVVAGGQVIIAICNYTFDAEPEGTPSKVIEPRSTVDTGSDEEVALVQKSKSGD